MLKKKSFFERLTGGMRMDEDDIIDEPKKTSNSMHSGLKSKIPLSSSKDEDKQGGDWLAEEEEEGELTVDVYQTAHEIVVQSMIAGVQPEHLSITITRDLITIKGKREVARGINEDNYFIKELYWGSFSRTISLPNEVEAEDAEAVEKHGLLTIKLPKINK
ncbi:Hsp20/alpha crystallin family protein, partial [Candidatus Nomurabacteria bacterium]|nr:Hsp20/alpha crystallin family protein [Candidatus Nomurabacteria bacterium]